MPVTVKDSSLFKHGSQRVEVMCVDLVALCCLIEFHKRRNVVEEWGVRFLPIQLVAGSGSISIEAELRKIPCVQEILDLVAEHIEEKDMMRGDDGLELVRIFSEQLHQMIRNDDSVVLVQG